jgi:hypothetical protein
MLIISDPNSWAKSNGYDLYPIQDVNFAVSFASKPLGALVRVSNGYKFVSEASEKAGDVDYEANCADHFVSRSFGLSEILPFSGENLDNRAKEVDLSAKVSGTGHSERISDFNYWLPYAAEHYCLSRDIRDYVLVPIPAIFSSLPNTNGDSLSLKEMLRFDPNLGMQMYKTFRGKPTFLEHQNKDITQAKGVILDSFLRPVPFNSKYYKIVQLLAYDRTKDSQLANSILTKQSNAYSVGFYYTSYTCSVCGTRVGKDINIHPCSHTKLGRPTYKQNDGKLVYRMCENAVGFECSAVATPAFTSAVGPHVYDVRSM